MAAVAQIALPSEVAGKLKPIAMTVALAFWLVKARYVSIQHHKYFSRSNDPGGFQITLFAATLSREIKRCACIQF